MNSNINNSSRNNNLNIIRFFAAVLVVLGHMYPLMGVPYYNIYNQAVSTIGVKIFFVISGYLKTKSFLSDSNIFSYSIKRIFRIMPGLIVLTFVTAYIIGPIFTDIPVSQYFGESYAGVKFYLRNALLFPVYNLPGVFGTNIYANAVNGSLWTLPVEVAMYIAIPIVIIIFKKLGNYKVGIVLFFVISLVANTIKLRSYPAARFVVYGTNVCDAMNLIPYFFIGAIFTFDIVKKYLNLQVASFLMFVLATMNISLVKMEILFVFVLPYFVFSFAFQEKPVFAKFGSKVDLSYGMYLYGFIVQQVLVKYFINKGLTVNVMFALSLIITMLVAVLSWYIVEKPAQKLGKKLTKKLNQ